MLRTCIKKFGLNKSGSWLLSVKGALSAGLANVKVCRQTVELWRLHNLFQFAEKFQVTVFVGEELATRL